MKDLRLGMGILATTTCYLDDEVFKLHPTKLIDAYESNSKHIKGLKIELGEGHWGACPTRDRDSVCINKNEVVELAKNRLTKHIELCKDHKPKRNLYYIEVNGMHSICIKVMQFSNSINSLREGNYNIYRGRNTKIKISDKLPKGFFYDIDKAIEYFSETSKKYFI